MESVPPFREYCFKTKRELSDSSKWGVFFGAIATLASFEELALSPKPGLVCPDSSGAHSDMNWVTFVMGASALAPYWNVQALDGFRLAHYKPLEAVAYSMREKGREMERAMYKATGGINTHKGLIFALSLLTGASGICARLGKWGGDDAFGKAAVLAEAIAAVDLEDVEDRARRGEKLTHGEKIYLAHGIGGIRTEAMRGFPSVKAGLLTFREAISRGASYRGAAIAALLTLMTVCEDTNVIHRGGMEFWKNEYRDLTRTATLKFDPLAPDFVEPVTELGRALVSRGISPGGAADLLVCTLFMYRSKIVDNRLAKKGE
jgi:triphosphoribosyl-dephospho-CoA synthetase